MNTESYLTYRWSELAQMPEARRAELGCTAPMDVIECLAKVEPKGPVGDPDHSSSYFFDLC